jgi:hypothetical protein
MYAQDRMFYLVFDTAQRKIVNIKDSIGLHLAECCGAA